MSSAAGHATAHAAGDGVGGRYAGRGTAYRQGIAAATGHAGGRHEDGSAGVGVGRQREGGQCRGPAGERRRTVGSDTATGIDETLRGAAQFDVHASADGEETATADVEVMFLRNGQKRFNLRFIKVRIMHMQINHSHPPLHHRSSLLTIIPLPNLFFYNCSKQYYALSYSPYLE